MTDAATMFRPRIKFPHRPVRYGDHRIRIGGIVPGIATDIVDPDGWVWALLERLDGRNTVEQIAAHLVRRWPAHPADDVRTAIADLVNAGYVEDVDEAAPADLPDDDLVRHSRGHALTLWWDRVPRRSGWDVQLLLRRARVTVIGLGGAGSAAALTLAVSGVGHLHCVDDDVVEPSNLNRQILYTESDLGLPKAEAAVRRLRAHDSGIAVTGERLRVDGPPALRSLAERCDVLLLTADQPHEIRSWANAACYATGTDWVHGGYHGPLVNVGMYRPGSGPCHDCALTAERERRATLPARTFWAPTPLTDEQVHAANAVSAGVAGQLAAHAAMSLITGAPALPVNREFGLNLVTLESGIAPGFPSPRSDCPSCGPSRS